ncbi:MAG TPA: hypothetical protein VMT37_12425 [Solirubrobacterales bacterium]|nr:hypothetical protein [Solirubrobacterales bacterium]
MLRLRPDRSLCAVLAVVVAVALAAPAVAAAGGTRIAGTLTGLPKKADLAAVEAVDPRGQIGGVDLVGGGGAFSLAVKPGTYVLASSAIEGEDELAGFGPAKKVRRGAKVRDHSKLKPLARSAAAGSRALLRRGSVLTVTGFEFTDNSTDPDVVHQLRSQLLNDLFRRCEDYVFVDTSPEFVKFAQQESALSRAGKLSTPFQYRPIPPQYEIFGSASFERERFLLELTATTTAHQGVPNAPTDLEVKLPEIDLETAENELRKADAAFAKKLCG